MSESHKKSVLMRSAASIIELLQLPAGSARSEHLSPAVLVESHSEPGEVPHPPAVSVPGGAHVEPAPMIDAHTAGQAPDGGLDVLQPVVGHVAFVHDHT